MPTYIQLLTLSPEGKAKALRDPQHVRRAEQAMESRDVEMLGVYGVLGPYDFVTIVEAPSNEAVARFSMELGVVVGAHVITLPAIPIGRMEADETEHAARTAVSMPETPAGQSRVRQIP